MLFTEPDGLHCQWLTEYYVVTDSLLTRFDATMRGPLLEPRINHCSQDIIDFALEFYADRIEEVKRRARENPASRLSCEFCITYEEIAQRYARPHARIGSQLRIRLPQDFQVRTQINILHAYRYARPEWAIGIGGDFAHDTGEAHAKAIELLKSWLSADQLREFEKDARFTVQGSDTGTHYRLISEHSYNILELDKEGALTGQKYCVVPSASVAMGDQLLAQKIWLETDETRTLKIANKVVRTGAQADNTMRSMNMITREAIRLFQNSNAFLREIAGEAEPDPRRRIEN